MMTTLKKAGFFILLLLGSYSTLNAQQLLSKTSKTWKVHWGVTGGAGMSTYLQNALPENAHFLPEGMAVYSVLYAPRPEVNLGVFTEFEFKSKFMLRMSLTYAMRAIPKPVYLTPSNPTVANQYQSIYLNGAGADLIFFYQPIKKMKFGMGFDMAHYFMTKKFRQGNYGAYAHHFMGYHGLKTVVAYNINPRMDISMYVSGGSSSMNKLFQFDNFNVGTTFTCKLKGKEYKIQKEIYKVDYTH